MPSNFKFKRPEIIKLLFRRPADRCLYLGWTNTVLCSQAGAGTQLFILQTGVDWTWTFGFKTHSCHLPQGCVCQRL